MAIVAGSMLLGCSDPTSTEIASSLDGAWKLSDNVPGGFFDFSLTSSGSQVSGTGIFVAEAGPGGTSTVTGSVEGKEVDLDFVLVTELTDGNRTSTAHFTGHLVLGSLRGTIQFGTASPDNPPAPAVFLRNNGGQLTTAQM